MNSVVQRGGIPRVVRCTAANSLGITGSGGGIAVGCPVDSQYGTMGRTNYIQILDVSGASIRLYFTRRAFEADAQLLATDGYITLPVAADSTWLGRLAWEGPADITEGNPGSTPVPSTPPVAVRDQALPLIFLRSTGVTASATVVFYHRHC